MSNFMSIWSKVQCTSNGLEKDKMKHSKKKQDRPGGNAQCQIEARHRPYLATEPLL